MMTTLADFRALGLIETQHFHALSAWMDYLEQCHTKRKPDVAVMIQNLRTDMKRQCG